MQKLTLKQHRLVKGLTQAQLADLIGVHVNTYANWEDNPGKVTIDKAKKIASSLQISVNDIFFAN